MTTIPTSKREKVYNRTGGNCAYCGMRLEFSGDWHVDHITPKSRNGGNSLKNLIPSCMKCNAAKRHRNPKEFRESIVSLSIRDIKKIKDRLERFRTHDELYHPMGDILNDLSEIQEKISEITIDFFLDDWQFDNVAEIRYGKHN